MTLSERILVANRGALERVRHMQMFRAISIFESTWRTTIQEIQKTLVVQCLYSVKLQPSLLKTTRQVLRQLLQAAA